MFSISRLSTGIFAAVTLLSSGAAIAHCDTLDGPVVAAASKALQSGNVNLILVWVQKNDEAEIRRLFERVNAARKAGPEARDLADMYLFENLVRIHRMGEGAPYTGLKPAGKPEPAVAAADRSVETGKLEPVANMIFQNMQKGLHGHFDAMMAKKKYKPDDVAAGRSFSSSYVEYVHYVERLYGAAQTLSPEHTAKDAVHRH
jgi:hypothetical protein